MTATVGSHITSCSCFWIIVATIMVAVARSIVDVTTVVIVLMNMLGVVIGL